MQQSARKTAFDALIRIERDAAFTNLLLEKALRQSGLSPTDKAFVSALVLGVTERKITLDYELSLYLSKPLKKLKPEVLTVLRLGAYQIFYMDKVPNSAAVNESVKLIKKEKCTYAVSLVNAVLRKCASNGLVFPKESDENYLSVYHSFPQWLVKKWTEEYSAGDASGILQKMNEKSKTTVRVNTLKADEQTLKNAFDAEGVEYAETDLENALDISLSGTDITSLPSFKSGLFHVQDKASQLCVKALDVKEGQTLIDLCASPGGKSFTAAQCMKNSGRILSFDKIEKRVKLITDGAQRLGIEIIEASVNDAQQLNSKMPMADRVLCDVPCSGLGVISKKPEIKYKKSEDFEKLSETQLKILKNASRYVKAGGRLVYSTCTLNKKENEEVCFAFLESCKDFVPVCALPEFSPEAFVTLMPHKNGCDGFFFAAFERKK